MYPEVEQIQEQMWLGNYKPQGNCYEAALALGIKLATDPEKNVRLANGSVRNRPHWWILTNEEIIDPTSNQFVNVTKTEYKQEKLEPVDLFALAWLLQIKAKDQYA